MESSSLWVWTSTNGSLKICLIGKKSSELALNFPTYPIYKVFFCFLSEKRKNEKRKKYLKKAPEKYVDQLSAVQHLKADRNTQQQREREREREKKSLGDAIEADINIFYEN